MALTDGLKLAGVLSVSEGDVETIGIRCSRFLRNGEKITGTPTVALYDGATDLAPANPQRNSVPMKLNKKDTPVDEAVLFSISGQTKGVYIVQFTYQTNAALARTITRGVKIEVGR